MLYRIEYTADDSTRPLVWDRRTRKTTAQIVKDILPQPGEIIVSMCDAPRSYAKFDAEFGTWDIFRHGNGRSPYYGHGYKTLTGALNKLDRLAETEVRA